MGMSLQDMSASVEEQAPRAFSLEMLSKMPLASLLYYILIGDGRVYAKPRQALRSAFNMPEQTPIATAQ
jgi:hypothetical protein